MTESASESRLPHFSSEEIVALRPEIDRPRAGSTALSWMMEFEPSCSDGRPIECLTILLRGSECQFRCLMCDLWKSTHREATPPGVIPAQIELVLKEVLASRSSLPPWVKLYNASNFFAEFNVPRQDLESIASLLGSFSRIVVENHPRVLNPRISEFQQMLNGRLEVAMGLETVHPEILPALNKHLTLKDFRNACLWLCEKGIDVRSFVLLRPPGLSEKQAVEWCLRSIEYSVDCGVRHCSVIPVRSGNGAMDRLKQRGLFERPLAQSLERVLSRRMRTEKKEVLTADLWDWEQLRGICKECSGRRKERVHCMNLEQRHEPEQACSHCETPPS